MARRTSPPSHCRIALDRYAAVGLTRCCARSSGRPEWTRPLPRRSASMNGPHDMGGMHGFGRVEPEQNEPVFHADWEKTVLAASGAVRSRGLVNIDEFRHAIERMPPAE